MSPLAEWTDEQFVPVFGDRGYEAHTVELCNRLHPEVRRVLQRRMSDDGGVEECEVDTWLRIYRGKHTFDDRGPGSAQVWVNAIADHTGCDWLRRKRNRQLPTVDWDTAPPPPVRGGGPDRTVQEAEEERQMHEGVKRLQPAQQAVLLLARPGTRDDSVGLGSLTLQQVADLLGYPGPPAVHRELKSTLAELRRTMGVGPAC